MDYETGPWAWWTLCSLQEAHGVVISPSGRTAWVKPKGELADGSYLQGLYEAVGYDAITHVRIGEHVGVWADDEFFFHDDQRQNAVIALTIQLVAGTPYPSELRGAVVVLGEDGPETTPLSMSMKRKLEVCVPAAVVTLEAMDFELPEEQRPERFPNLAFTEELQKHEEMDADAGPSIERVPHF